MKKELLIAIIVGFGLGLVIVFGIRTANQAIKTSPSETPPALESRPTLTSSPEFLLTINNPENDSISDQEKIEISGQTGAQAMVAIVFSEGEKIVQADEKGNFVAEITLTGGINQIEVSASDNDGNETSKSLSIVYSTSTI